MGTKLGSAQAGAEVGWAVRGGGRRGVRSVRRKTDDCGKRGIDSFERDAWFVERGKKRR